MKHTKPFQANLSEIQRTNWLSLREDTCQFLREELPSFLNNNFRNRYLRLGEFVLSLRSGEYIEKASYSNEVTDYVYVSVNNFSAEIINFDDIVFLDPAVGERYQSIALENGDLIITRSGTVGCVHIFQAPDKEHYIPSHHLAIVKLPEKNSHLQFLKYYLQTNFAKDFFWAHATGKSQKEITNWSIRRMPVPKSQRYTEIAHSCQKIEQEIDRLRKDQVTLQHIIGDVLTRQDIRKTGGIELKEVLHSSLENISEQLYFRCSAQYRAFYENHDGLLFDDPNPKYPIRRVGELMRPYPASVLKKGVLEEEYILLDLDQVEAKTGRIIDETNVVMEIGSDKVEFGDCDLIVGKLRPYLGYVLLNDKEKPYIGTTELLPFSANNDLALPEYIHYLLLSYEFLHVSSMLMYGKEHPRIHPRDLLHIRVPCPSTEFQEKIVTEIHSKEQKNQESKDKIKRLRQEIDRTLWKMLTEGRAT